jgi:methylthioribose-1-phosphate isomerase
LELRQVRGAPAIAIVAILSLAVELHVETFHRSHSPFTHPSHVSAFIHDKLEFLKTSRPTAVNLFEAAARFDALAKSASLTTTDPTVVVQSFLSAAEEMLSKDVQDNQAIGEYGAEWILNRTGSTQVCLLTHCNTGSLATAGWVRSVSLSYQISDTKCNMVGHGTWNYAFVTRD